VPVPGAPADVPSKPVVVPSKPSSPGVVHGTPGIDQERTVLKNFIATGKNDAVQKLKSLLQIADVKQMLAKRDGRLAFVVDLSGYEDVRKEMVRRARINGWIQ
jgi:hypothetical protein